MALTFGRWIAAMIAGCLVAAVLVLVPSKATESDLTAREELGRSEGRLQLQATQAALGLRILQLRDSITRGLAVVRQSDSGRVLVSGSLPPKVRLAVQSVVARMKPFRSRAAHQSTDIAFVLDVLDNVRGATIPQRFLRVAHVLPDGPGSHCLALVQLWFHDEDLAYYWRRQLTGHAAAQRILGPCSFYERFGTPGPAVDRWLRGGAWKFGVGGAWSPVPTGNALRQYESYASEYSSLPSFLEEFFVRSDLRGALSPDVYRCTSGDAGTCRSLVTAGGVDPGVRRWSAVSNDGVVRFLFNYDGSPIVAGFGPAEPQLLADMARELGDDRFRRFWTSDKSPAEAFAAAAGQDIGVWTAEWARSNYGEVNVGPGMDSASVAFALLAALIAIAGAIVAARRRQVA